MAVFESTEKMFEVLGDLFETLLEHPVAGEKFKKQAVTIRFIMNEPQGEIWLLPEGKVVCGVPEGLKADISMTLSGDTAHNFWLKKITMPVALAKGLIRAKGPLAKVLKLLPILNPAYEAYPAIAKKHGLNI
ncbi:MAG: hypothetical protein GXO70_05245 [Acidobacteria bacterium]|nr:hypothetical protein [Acidobacteriota bacterium]